MLRRQSLYARCLLAGFCFIFLTFAAKAQAPVRTQAPVKTQAPIRQDQTGCAARNIDAAIRGCTGIIEGRSADRAKLVQAYLNRGKALAKQGSFGQAIADFDQVIRLSPGNPEAYRERGASYGERNETEKAEADLTTAIGSSPHDAKADAAGSCNYTSRGWFYKVNRGDESAKPDFEQAKSLADKAIAAKQDLAKAYYCRAEAFAGLGNYDRAVGDDNEAIKLKPDDEVAHADRGIIYELKGDKDRAVADLSKALDLQPGYWRALRERAGLFIQKKDYEHAIADYDLAIELSKDNAKAYNLRGSALSTKGDKDRAIADFDEAIRLSPNFVDAYSNRGWAFLSKKNYDGAVADFTRAIELSPKRSGVYAGRGMAYSGKKDFDHAISDMDAAIRIEPNSDNYDSRGPIYEKMGDDAKALADFSEAIRLNPDNWSAYTNRQSIYAKQGDYDKQIADLKEAIRVWPDNDTMHILLAQAYNSKKENDRAIAVLDRLLQRKPGNYGAYRARANFHFEAKEYDAVIGDANEMIRLKADAAEGYSHRATAYALKRDLDKAISDLTQAIRLDPDGDQTSYYMRGSLYNRKGDYEHAVGDVSQVIKLGLAHIAESGAAGSDRLQQVYSSEVRGAYSERSMYRANMGDFENALADCNEVISRWPESSEGYRGRGQLNYWRKEYGLAISDFDKALQLEPRDSVSRSVKALALLRLGKADEASAAAESGLRIGADRDRFLGVRGEIAYEQGKFAQAIDDLSEAVKLAAFEAPTYYLRRGQAYEKLGQKALAMADYKAAADLNAPNPSQREARVLARERLAVLQGEALTERQPAQPLQHPIDPGRRIALVIGVSSYEKADRLPNPVHDAEAIAKALRELGFAEVIEVRDPDRASLEKAVRDFGDKAEQADWAVVFYAGHGISVGGRNYLIPRDADLGNERHLEFETVSLDRVLDSVAGAKKLPLVILDSCRNSPFLSRMMRQSGRSVRSLGQGLAAVDPQQNQFVVYATKDGSTAEDGAGDHSPFTQALLTHIGEAGVDIRFLFSEVGESVRKITQNRQNPFTYGSLPAERFFFKIAAAESR